MLQHLDRLSSIESLALPEGIDRTIHQNRLLKLAREGRKMSSRDLTRFSAARRHAILVCVLEEARATLTDEVIELHERMLNSLFSKAKRTQAERLQQTGKLIQSKLRQYIDVGQALVVIKDMYRKQSRKVPATAPLEFVPESWRKVVITPAGIDRQYYEFCALNELKGALRSGDIWVKGSRRYSGDKGVKIALLLRRDLVKGTSLMNQKDVKQRACSGASRRADAGKIKSTYLRGGIHRFEGMTMPPQPLRRTKNRAAVTEQQPGHFTFLQHDKGSQMGKLTGS